MFNQPVLDDANAANETTGLKPAAVPALANNTGKTDELSLAVAAANAPKHVDVVVEKPRGPGKYRLTYVYNGELIRESHETVRQAVARVAALKRLNIIPETSTAA